MFVYSTAGPLALWALFCSRRPLYIQNSLISHHCLSQVRQKPVSWDILKIWAIGYTFHFSLSLPKKTHELDFQSHFCQAVLSKAVEYCNLTDFWSSHTAFWYCLFLLSLCLCGVMQSGASISPSSWHHSMVYFLNIYYFVVFNIFIPSYMVYFPQHLRNFSSLLVDNISFNKY